jgi:hypothetical protein
MPINKRHHLPSGLQLSLNLLFRRESNQERMAKIISRYASTLSRLFVDTFAATDFPEKKGTSFFVMGVEDDFGGPLLPLDPFPAFSNCESKNVLTTLACSLSKVTQSGNLDLSPLTSDHSSSYPAFTPKPAPMSSVDNHLYTIIADLQRQLATQNDILSNLQWRLPSNSNPLQSANDNIPSPTALLSWIRLWKKFQAHKIPFTEYFSPPTCFFYKILLGGQCVNW